MAKGIVKDYKVPRGWGYIRGEDRNDYFVHWSFIEGSGYNVLCTGEKVEFEPVTTEDGRLQAHNVTYPTVEKTQRIKLKSNPFTPQEPVTDPKKFAGRGEVIRNAVDALYNHKNIIVTGERGIGKSSVAYQLIYMAQGLRELLNKLDIDTGDFRFSYATGDHRCVPEDTLFDIVGALLNSLLINLNIKEKETKKETEWGVDLKFFKIGQKKEKEQIEFPELADQFVNFVSDIIKKNVGQFNGITFLIDEIDCLSDDVQLAPFLKATAEGFKFKQCNNVSFVIAGVTGTITNLITQHPSFSRLIENIELRRMPMDELDEIIVNALRGTGVGIRSQVKKIIIKLADRFPEPVQLLGYHTYRFDNNNLLEGNDLNRAIDFVINHLKRYEFNELYKKIESSKLSEAIIRAMAAPQINEISVSEVAKKLNRDERATALELGSLAEKGVMIKTGRGMYKLRDPLFNVYLRWILKMDREPLK